MLFGSNSDLELKFKLDDPTTLKSCSSHTSDILAVDKYKCSMYMPPVDATRQGTPDFIAEALACHNLHPVKHLPFQDVKDLNEDFFVHPQVDRAHSDKDFF